MKVSKNANGINAKLVYDGGDKVWIPEEMGTPKEDQMQGTAGEQLSELSGRMCYDRCGIGRPSFTTQSDIGFHDHIKEAGHLSVCEHFNFTVRLYAPRKEHHAEIALVCANRPGIIFLQDQHSSQHIRLVVNLRAVRDWDKFIYRSCGRRDAYFLESYENLGNILRDAAHELAPHIVPLPQYTRNENINKLWYLCPPNELQNDHEKWISLYLSGSRVFSHVGNPTGNTACTQAGRRIDTPVFPQTELIFSASTFEWRWMINQRGCPIPSAWAAADAEIREVFCKALPELQRSRYGDRFEDYVLTDSPDGIGQVITTK